MNCNKKNSTCYPCTLLFVNTSSCYFCFFCWTTLKQAFGTLTCFWLHSTQCACFALQLLLRCNYLLYLVSSAKAIAKQKCNTLKSRKTAIASFDNTCYTCEASKQKTSKEVLTMFLFLFCSCFLHVLLAIQFRPKRSMEARQVFCYFCSSQEACYFVLAYFLLLIRSKQKQERSTVSKRSIGSIRSIVSTSLQRKKQK